MVECHKRTGDECMENIVYTTIMLALVGFALTAQTAFATAEDDYKYRFKRAEGDYQTQATDRDPGDNIEVYSNEDISICHVKRAIP
jgi:hypothetical protein